MWPLVCTTVLLLKVSTKFPSKIIILKIVVTTLITKLTLASFTSTLFITFILHVVFISKFEI